MGGSSLLSEVTGKIRCFQILWLRTKQSNFILVQTDFSLNMSGLVVIVPFRIKEVLNLTRATFKKKQGANPCCEDSYALAN